MKQERLLEIVAAYGASPERWPAAERPMAERLLAEQPALRARLAAEAELDRLLDLPAPPPPSQLHARIVAATVGRPQHRPWRWGTVVRGWRPLAPAVAGLAAALALGLLIGTAIPAAAPDVETGFSVALFGPEIVDEDLL